MRRRWQVKEYEAVGTMGGQMGRGKKGTKEVDRTGYVVDLDILETAEFFS